MSIPILIVGDGPQMNSGLSRIARDITTRMHAESEALGIEVAQLGWNYADEPFPWRVVPIHDFDNWGEKDLCNVWWKLFGNRSGVVFAIWDPGRIFNLTAQSGKLPVQIWTYSAIDSVDSQGSLGGPAAAALTRCERILAYGAFGERVIQDAMKRAGRTISIDHLPHGIDPVFKPFDAKKQPLVGSVMANIGRKDFGVLFQAWAIMAKADPTLNFWLHTNYDVAKAWSVPELVSQFGLASRFLLTGPEELKAQLTDEQLAAYYSQCLVTILPSPEGFGYPIVESMACGTPVIHIDYAGGAELVPRDDWKSRVKSFRLEGPYALQRPVLAAESIASRALAAIKWAQADPRLAQAYCVGAVEHLRWDSLWPRWRYWIERGLQPLR